MYIVEFYCDEVYSWSSPTFTVPFEDLQEALLLRDMLVSKVSNINKVVIRMEKIVWYREEDAEEEVGEK